jgi:phage N-6-adenine-methyltransferase
MVDKVHFSSGRTDWETPPEVMKAFHDVFGKFDLDPCAIDSTRKAAVCFREGVNGLDEAWWGKVFVNPPYGRKWTQAWIRKCHEEVAEGRADLVVALLASRTDTPGWHDHIMEATHVIFVRGRIRFVGAQHSAPFPSVIVVWQKGLLGCPQYGKIKIR